MAEQSLSHAVALSRDVDRLQEIKKRVNVLPLGRYTVNIHSLSDNDFHPQTWSVNKNDSCFQWCHRWNTIWHRQGAAAERSDYLADNITRLLLSTAIFHLCLYFWNMCFLKIETIPFLLIWICRAGVWWHQSKQHGCHRPKRLCWYVNPTCQSAVIHKWIQADIHEACSCLCVFL